jgi:hypothetical protein
MRVALAVGVAKSEKGEKHEKMRINRILVSDKHQISISDANEPF